MSSKWNRLSKLKGCDSREVKTASSPWLMTSCLTIVQSYDLPEKGDITGSEVPVVTPFSDGHMTTFQLLSEMATVMSLAASCGHITVLWWFCWKGTLLIFAIENQMTDSFYDITTYEHNGDHHNLRTVFTKHVLLHCSFYTDIQIRHILVDLWLVDLLVSQIWSMLR